MQEIGSPSDIDVNSKRKWEPDYTCHGRPPLILAICLHTQFVKFFGGRVNAIEATVKAPIEPCLQNSCWAFHVNIEIIFSVM